MHFNYSNWIIPVILFLALIIYFIIITENKFNEWVEDHFFYKTTILKKTSFYLGLAGVVFLVFSLLDLRGEEQRIKGKVSNQRTLILIDTSTSMLAEDVRPSRFEKAIFLARHFVKRAVGHHISVVTFSDMQKRLIPFTEDIDLLDSRINGLKNMKIQKGGTNLNFAIQESLQYFKENNPQEPTGNLLIFTDAEENHGDLNVEIKEGVSVAVVGIGTRKGGVIPLRNRNGGFVGNKKFKGETVISKLDETYIKSLGKNIKHYKWWLASSYVIPTKEILNFFQQIHKVKTSKDDIRIKPVLSHYLLVPGVVALCLSYILSLFKSFRPLALILIFLVGNLHASDQEKKEKPPLPPHIRDGLNEYAKGNLSNEQKISLAEEFLENDRADQASAVYSDSLKKINKSNINDYFNSGTADIKNGNVFNGLRKYKKIEKFLKSNKINSNVLNKIKKNRLKAIEQKDKQNQQNKKEQDKKKEQDSKDEDQKNEDQQKKGQKNEDEQKKDQKNEDQEKQDQKSEDQQKQDQKSEDQQKQDQKSEGQQNQDKEKEGQLKQDQKDQDQKNKGQKEQDQQKQDQKNKDQQEKDKGDEEKDGEEKENKQPEKGKSSKDKNENKGKKKMPVILKQLVDQDKSLQEKLLDTSNENRRKNRDKKDW